MAKKTKRERIITMLLANGFKEVKSKSKKYQKLEGTIPDPGGNGFLFLTRHIGKSGGVRAGEKISNSLSLTSIVWREVLKWEFGKKLWYQGGK